MRRRRFLSTAALGGMAAAAMQGEAADQEAPAGSGRLELHWLDGAPPTADAVISWGVPWPRGRFQKEQSFALTAADGKTLPAQNPR